MEYDYLNDPDINIEQLKSTMKATPEKRFKMLEEMYDFFWVKRSPEKRKLALKLIELGF